VGPSNRLVALLCHLFLFSLLGFIEEALQLFFLGQNFQQLKDHWNIVVTPAFVLRAPVGLSLLFLLNFDVLDHHTFLNLAQTRRQCLHTLRGQSCDLPTAHFICAKIGAGACGDASLKLTGLLLHDPVLELSEARFLFLELRNLVANHCQQVESDFVARVSLNTRLNFSPG